MFTVQRNWLKQTNLECLIVGIHHPGLSLKGTLPLCDKAMNHHISALIKSGDLSTKKKTVSILHTLGQVNTKRIIFVGLGRSQQVSEEDWKEGVAKAFRKVQDLRLESVAIDIDSFISETISIERATHLVGEVYMQSLYSFQGYKQSNHVSKVNIKNISIFTNENHELLQKQMSNGFIFGKATNYARTLVNLPPNILTATVLAQYARETGERYGFEVEILYKKELEELGMGALLAVNQGSVEPPAMIVLKYQGQKEWKDVIGLVGKGVTYDTGGYSLKPRESMINMKTDMGGAAAVLGAMEIIGELKPKQNVVAVIAATDNMVSGTAFKPDDVITSLSGKTIEVLNTDAEGRLALADAVTYAKQHGANYIVDVATLTGGVIVALGSEMTGVFTNNQALLNQVKQSSEKVGEPIWQLPITAKDREKVKNSKIADLNNSPSREGHAIMGAAFVGEFAESTPWVHLDIAGTSVVKKATDLQSFGGTGVMVKTLAQLVLDFKPL